MLRRSFCLAAAVAALALVAGSATGHSQSRPSRVVAIGDIHGAADDLAAILQAAGLIDARGGWSGGTATLVQTGDYLNRGAKVRIVLDMLMRLEKEAKAAGGRVEVLMGNHEAMNLLHDFTYVSPEAFSAFVDPRSEDRRERAYQDYAFIMRRSGRSAQAQDAWKATHPPGFVEYAEAMEPRGLYGRWLRARKVVVKEDGTIFMHAGLTADTNGGLDDVNRTVARDLETWDAAHELLLRADLIRPFFTLREVLEANVAELQRIAAAVKAKEPPGDHVSREFVQSLQAAAQIGQSSLLNADGPLWFRGFATWSDSDGAKIAALLEKFQATRFVSAHTPMVDAIKPRFDNRLFLIDTGMLSSHYKGGRASALEISGDTISAIYVDSRATLVAPQGAGRAPAPAIRARARPRFDRS